MRAQHPIATINSADLLSASAFNTYSSQVRIELLSGVGHFLMLEQPSRFYILLNRLLETPC